MACNGHHFGLLSLHRSLLDMWTNKRGRTYTHTHIHSYISNRRLGSTERPTGSISCLIEFGWHANMMLNSTLTYVYVTIYITLYYVCVCVYMMLLMNGILFAAAWYASTKTSVILCVNSFNPWEMATVFSLGCNKCNKQSCRHRCIVVINANCQLSATLLSFWWIDKYRNQMENALYCAIECRILRII